MIKTIATAVILMGMVALGMAQNTHQRPIMSLVDAGTNSVTIQVTAGDQGAPYGFLINWASPRQGKHNVVFDGSGCPEYSLPPFGSVDVTINGLSGSSCVINESPWPINCGEAIRFLGRLVGLGTSINGFTTLTDPCP
jgi:hypothetical protein